MTHTPSPWVGEHYQIWSKNGIEDSPILGVNETGRGLIAETVSPCNLHLIAAAPDLLEALKLAKKALLPYARGVLCRDELDVIEKIDEALSKAEGN